MTDHVLSQHWDADKPKRIDDLPGQLIMQVDGDGQTVVKSNEPPKQLGLFRGDTDDDNRKVY